MKKIITVLLAILLVSSSFLLSCGKNKTVKNTTTVDFSNLTGEEVQNIKKIEQFSPTWQFVGSGRGLTNGHTMEQFAFLDDLQTEQFRIDLMMGNGGIGSLIGADGMNGSSDKEMSPIMELAKKLKQYKVDPMLVMCDISEYAQINGEGKALPDMDRWYEVLYNVATYIKNHGINNVTYETWNEPDLGTIFWGGSMTDMIETSITSTKALRAADKYSTIAALGLCWPMDFITKKETVNGETLTHWDRFWKRSSEENALPDALSWHYYGQPGGIMEGNLDVTTDFSYWLEKLRKEFRKSTNVDVNNTSIDLSTMQQLVTEYHSASSYDSLEDTVGNISKMYDAIGYALNATDITKVYWACYVSELFGVINSNSFQKNSGYNVLWSYARLPISRVKCDFNDDEIGYYCGTDNNRAGLIIYNKGSEKKDVNLNFKGLPFTAKDMTIYSIDNRNLATSMDITTPYVFDRKTSELDKASLSLGVNEGYYIELSDGTGTSEIEINRSIGDILKKEYYYYDRGNKFPYSDLHNNSLTATVSMASSLSGRSAVSVIIDTKKTCDSFTVNYNGYGKFIHANDSAIGMKIDYQTESGFEKSVFYAIDGYNYDLVLPFGTKTNANEIVNVNGLNGSFVVNLKEKAPNDWNGIISITYIIKDAGVGATEKFIIEPNS